LLHEDSKHLISRELKEPTEAAFKSRRADAKEERAGAIGKTTEGLRVQSRQNTWKYIHYPTAEKAGFSKRESKKRREISRME
jgi:hypothetical protein